MFETLRFHGYREVKYLRYLVQLGIPLRPHDYLPSVPDDVR